MLTKYIYNRWLHTYMSGLQKHCFKQNLMSSPALICYTGVVNNDNWCLHRCQSKTINGRVQQCYHPSDFHKYRTACFGPITSTYS
jgi:hypothetical protein